MAAFILQWWAELNTDCKTKSSLLSGVLQKSFSNLVSCIYVPMYKYIYIYTHRLILSLLYIIYITVTYMLVIIYVIYEYGIYELFTHWEQII